MLPIRQPHIQNGLFYNEPDEKPHKRVIFRTGLMLARSLVERNLPNFANEKPAQDPMAIYAPEVPALWSQTPKVTWIGHATFLIQIGGVNILTDPIFGSPTPFFSRNAPPGIVPKDLPPIDVVLISHNHMDHMDSASLHALRPELHKNHGHILVPFGDEEWFQKRSFERVTPFHWGQGKKIHISTKNREVLSSMAEEAAPQRPEKGSYANLTFTFLPARHWSRRSLFDRNRSLWGSWMIECNGQNIYFAGDTAFADHFIEIRKHFPSIDTALMPIAPCEPDHIMREMHMNAEEAVQAYLDLNAKQFVPMHWHTFNFGHDTLMAPLNRLKKKWELLQLPQDELILPNIGAGLGLQKN